MNETEFTQGDGKAIGYVYFYHHGKNYLFKCDSTFVDKELNELSQDRIDDFCDIIEEELVPHLFKYEQEQDMCDFYSKNAYFKQND